MVANFWFIYLLDAKSNEFTKSTQKHGLVNIITMVNKCMYCIYKCMLLICESPSVTIFKWCDFFSCKRDNALFSSIQKILCGHFMNPFELKDKALRASFSIFPYSLHEMKRIYILTELQSRTEFLSHKIFMIL